MRPRCSRCLFVFDRLSNLLWIPALCCDAGRGRVRDCFASAFVFVFEVFAVGAVSALCDPTPQRSSTIHHLMPLSPML